MSAAVAVARGPHLSAAHTSGRTARNASALLYAVCSISGLKAMTPTTAAATSAAADAKTLLKLKVLVHRRAPTARRPAQQRARRPHRAATTPSMRQRRRSIRGIRRRQAPEHPVALIIVMAQQDECELRHAGGRIERLLATVRDVEQVAADDRRQRVRRHRQGHHGRIGGAGISEVGRHAGRIGRLKSPAIREYPAR